MNHHTPLCPSCGQPLPLEKRDPRRLTARELEICALLADGAKNLLICTKLCIELGTVKNHVHSILHKLGLQNRTQAAIWYSNRYKAE